MKPRRVVLQAGLGALLIAGTACGSGTGLKPGARTIYMAAVEMKGTGEVAKEAFPPAALPQGGGYALVAPDAKGEWKVENYRWMPGEVTVVEGDRVTLEILGVNGSSHSSTIDAFGQAFDVKRGQLTTVSFTAGKAGIFQIVCKVHQPSMTASLVVLPK